PSGQIGCGQIAGIEHRADRLALELLAPEAEVRRALEAQSVALKDALRPQIERVLQNAFGLPQPVAREYTMFLIGLLRHRTSVREWLEMDGIERQTMRRPVELRPRPRNHR